MMNKKSTKQTDLRRLMGEIKKQSPAKKKIDSPLAKYDQGQLTCIVCNAAVGSEAVWPVHLNSKKHRDNFSKKFKRKENPSLATELEPIAKKTATGVISNELSKPVKGILKNSFSKPNVPVKVVGTVVENKPEEVKVLAKEEEEEEEEILEEENSNQVPEGFFDDRKLDAKARNVEYRDPIEEEWQQFQKEIREESTKAQEIISEEQEEATNERQLEEIDEQLRHWSRVLSLEKKKEETLQLTCPVKEEVYDDNDDDDDDFDEFVDWRSKKSFLK